MYLRIDARKLLEKCKTTWTKIEDLQNNELNALPSYDDRFIKTKITTYGDKVYTNFCGLNVLEDGVESIISIDIFTYLQQQISTASIFKQLYL